MRFRVGLILISIFTAACGASSPAAPTSSSAFSQVDLVVGNGTTANVGNRVTVSYTGWLYDAKQPNGKGREFDANSAYSFTIGSGTVIKGWDQGVAGMRVGGQRRLVIPPELAYGANSIASAGIPSNATLVFDIALLGVG